jgi:nucleoid DNA-binding protein
MPGIGDIAGKVAAKTGLTVVAAKEAVNATLEAIKELSFDGTVSAAPLGTFKIKHREARNGRNPSTGADLVIAEKDVLTFKPTDKEAVAPKAAKPARGAKAAPAKAAPAAPAKAAGRRGRK